jgi:putative endonuclease
MYTVYVLRDEAGNLYKGMTINLRRRLSEHRRGHTKSTKKLKNPLVVYSEELPDRESARAREKYLKSAAGRRFLKSKLCS